MKEMINIALTSEYNFQKTFAHMPELVHSQGKVIGIADNDNTFSHYPLYEECEKQSKKPIYGVRVMAVKSPEERVRPRGQWGPTYILLAKNHAGLKEIYDMVYRATDCFYYRPHVGLVDIWTLSENVIVISEDFHIDERIDYIGISFRTPKHLRYRTDIPRVALQASKYILPDDREVYELFAGARKMENNSYPGHILSTAEWMAYFNDEEAVNNTHVISEQCNCELKTAKPVKYLGNLKLEDLCIDGAERLGIDLNDPVYKARYERELKLIDEKDFRDYFMIVQEMVNKAKSEMLVGPGRGSSGGSLICYLIGITEVDPIKWDLLFERFIDINRNDMPDIDVDFPDKKREKVIKELTKTNGREKVKHIATVSKMKVKSSMGDFAKELGIPPWEIEEVTKTLQGRSSGDIRHATEENRIESALNGSEAGRKLLEKYPKLTLAGRIEEHSRHTGVHAAGMIVSSENLSNFAGINARDKTFMMEHKPAEKIGLLKMDCLGLTTLSVLEDVARMVGFDYNDYYKLEFNDDEVFKIFREGRLTGIFQFEGYSLKNLCRGISVSNFEDIVAITALARPGPLHGGAAALFSEIHSGKKDIEWIMDHPAAKKATENTLGTIVYQEQLMQICREIGNMNWEQVNDIRRGTSKKKGKDYFNKYKEIFLDGARSHGIDDDEAAEAWEAMLTFGAYGFNRSHAVAYGMVSYWTAWAKRYYPLEFVASSLNNAGTTDSHIKLLREARQFDNIYHVPVDPDESDINWTVKDGKLIGGLTNIKGIGKANAQKIIKCREQGVLPPNNLIRKLAKPETDFDILFPCRHYWGKLFDNPDDFGLDRPPSEIKDIERKGSHVFIGKMIKKNVRDLNELVNVHKRGGEVYEEDTYLMNLTLEDDTDVIMARIGRRDFERIGRTIAEEGREGVDYYLVKGDIISDEIRFVFIKEIFKLGDGVNETVYDI